MSHLDRAEREELGSRFPIVVVEYDPAWPGLYEREAELLTSEFGRDVIVELHHVGSTSVPGLAAKAVIDMVAVVSSAQIVDSEIRPALEKRGYIYGWQPGPERGHAVMWNGYVPEEPVKYHLHMAPAGHPIMDMLVFRDYLRDHPETAKRYEELKYELAETYRHDREGYTWAKTDFVTEITKGARMDRPEPLSG